MRSLNEPVVAVLSFTGLPLAKDGGDGGSSLLMIVALIMISATPTHAKGEKCQ